MLRVRLAKLAVEINNRFPELEALCRDYLTDDEPQLTLSVSPGELEKERAAQAEIFSDGYLESVSLYRKLALELLRHGVFLMHASVVELDGEGYAFLAHSGTGKTTQTRLWLEHFGSRARVINGDKPLIRAEAAENGWRFVACGTPWCGKEGMGCNAEVPLKALFLLERSAVPSCEAAEQGYSIDRIFHQLLMPEEPELMLKLLELVDCLVENVPCYRLRCDMTAASVLAAYEAAQGK